MLDCFLTTDDTESFLLLNRHPDIEECTNLHNLQRIVIIHFLVQLGYFNKHNFPCISRGALALRPAR